MKKKREVKKIQRRQRKLQREGKKKDKRRRHWGTNSNRLIQNTDEETMEMKKMKGRRKNRREERGLGKNQRERKGTDAEGNRRRK